MTPQEAIERLRKIPVRPKPDNALDMLAIIMAVKALEKQNPKKPLKNYGGGYRCPNCQMKHFNPDWIGVKHCDCGQALDWSDN